MSADGTSFIHELHMVVDSTSDCSMKPRLSGAIESKMPREQNHVAASQAEHCIDILS